MALVTVRSDFGAQQNKICRCFLFYKPRQHIKQRYHLLTKIHIVKAVIFPVIMYGCESWTIKKAES